MPAKFLIITEKHGASDHLRDGGAQVVDSLISMLGDDATVIQFGDTNGVEHAQRLAYPIDHPDRFHRRLLNADWVAQQVALAAVDFTDVIFVHASMLFGIRDGMIGGKRIWLLPMFLGLSYRLAGENPPEEYLESERRCLRLAHRIITPSHLEKHQLTSYYEVPPEMIKVIPRGVPKPPEARRRPKPDGELRFCSVGSIKRQKNTIGLIQRFFTIAKHHPKASLRLVGPIQDLTYFREVEAEIAKHQLEGLVTFTGYVRRELIAEKLSDCHIHLTDSRCETFGRTIYETLALGLPNLLPNHQGCAATEHLKDAPYAYFYSTDEEMLQGVSELLDPYSERSSLALEVAHVFEQARLDRLVLAELRSQPTLLFADFDGTLFHKHDPELTRRMITKARTFPRLAICSARSAANLRGMMNELGLEPDWLIGSSGAEIESYQEGPLNQEGLLPREIDELLSLFPDAQRIQSGALTTQVRTRSRHAPLGFRAETYPEGTYLSPWRCSKLRGALKLIDLVDWRGRVTAWGDGPHDMPLITFFDGIVFPRDAQMPTEIS